MEQFLSPLLGGVLIGLASVLHLLMQGRVAGCSGIFGSVVTAKGWKDWRLAFVLGLVGAGVSLYGFMPEAFENTLERSLWAVGAGGLLVGFGTGLGKGCTSGHGVCGMSRGSMRSIAATLTFMAAGMVTVFLVRTVAGGAL
ncbi:MAG: YeeE/YedE family protein [Myxococcota bacterium]